MSDTPLLTAWTERLQGVLDTTGGGRVFVVAETGSTQDEARRGAARPGDVVTTLRQRAGRGRHGRAWADTRDEGLAVTLLIEPTRAASLAIACAVGVAEALESLGVGGVGVKWPNDIMAGGRKLGGVLIEQDGRVAAIGIGINVAQASWPDDLAGVAVSLRELGCPGGRLDVAAALLPAVRATLQRPEAAIVDAFAARDVLRGRRAVIRSGDRRVEGLIVRIEPTRCLVIEIDGREEEIPAATAVVERLV